MISVYKYIRNNLLNLEKNISEGIIKLWKEKRIRAEIFIIISIIIMIFSRLPYVNLIFYPPTSYILILLLAFVMFGIKKEKLLIVALMLFVLALFNALRGNEASAESIGVNIYFIMIAVVCYYMKDIWKTKIK